MSSTPLFDAVARRRSRAAGPVAAPSPSTAPTSPLTSTAAQSPSVLVPAALVAAIEAIPTTMTPYGSEHRVTVEQLALVEAVADAVTRAVVDAVAEEVERIARDGVVRA